MLNARLPNLKITAPYLLQAQVLIIIVTVNLHNYVRQEVCKDWLFEKHDHDDIIAIVDDDEKEDDEQDFYIFILH